MHFKKAAKCHYPHFRDEEIQAETDLTEVNRVNSQVSSPTPMQPSRTQGKAYFLDSSPTTVPNQNSDWMTNPQKTANLSLMPWELSQLSDAPRGCPGAGKGKPDNWSRYTPPKKGRIQQLVSASANIYPPPRCFTKGHTGSAQHTQEVQFFGDAVATKCILASFSVPLPAAAMRLRRTFVTVVECLGRV